jgi:hypothetical protein
MYEGFEKQTTANKKKEEEKKEEKKEEKEEEEEEKEEEKDDKKSENDSRTVSDLKTMLKKLEKLMEPQIKTPDTDTPPPKDSSSDKVKASGLTKQPEYHDSVKSQPGTSESYRSDDTCLEQGKNYKSMYPSDTNYEKRIKQQCPPAVQCPDMRDYIRKDSIPCWACKLK